MLKALVVVVPIVLAIYCLVQVVQSRADQVRRLPRWAWVVLVVLFPLLGSVAWLALGRPQHTQRPAPRPGRQRPVAPDDDPDFLRGIHEDPYDKPDDQR